MVGCPSCNCRSLCRCTGNALGVECCGLDVDSDPLPEIVPDSQRYCTDTPFLIAFICVLLSQIFLISYSTSKGSDPTWLFHGIDIDSNVCDKHNENGSLAMWPEPAYYAVILCTDDCNSTMSDDRMVERHESEEFLKAWCLPTQIDLLATWDSASESWNRAMGDIIIARWLIVVSAFIALALCFMYASFIGKCGWVIVWLTIFLSALGGFGLGYAMILKGRELIRYGWTYTGRFLYWTGITLVVFDAIFMIGIIYMRNRIRLATRVINEAAKAMEEIPTIVVFPVVCFIGACLYFLFWMYTAVYIYSVSEVKEYELPSSLQLTLGRTYYDHDQFDKGMQRALIYHMFGLLWVFQFIIYYTYSVIAHVFAEWYFSRWDETSGRKIRGNEPNELSTRPIWGAWLRVTKFHLGSLALGSLIVAVVRFCNYCLTYVQAKAAGKQNPIALVLFNCTRCILKTLECCIDALNKNGFVFTAVYGTPFCYSSKAAFKLVWNNLVRVAAITVVSTYLEFLGKIAICVMTTGICSFTMQTYDLYEEQLSSYIFPTIAIIALSFAVGSIFMIVFEVAIDTIFLCFLIDEHCNKGTGRMYASKSLLKLINEQMTESIATAHHMKKTSMAHHFDEVELEEIQRRDTKWAMERYQEDEDSFDRKQSRRESKGRRSSKKKRSSRRVQQREDSLDGDVL